MQAPDVVAALIVVCMLYHRHCKQVAEGLQRRRAQAVKREEDRQFPFLIS